MFQHCGHQAPVVDFQWDPEDPWTLISVSDDVQSELGGGTLQIWRVNDMIYRPEAEVLAELEQHREFVLTGKDAPAPKPAGKGTKRSIDELTSDQANGTAKSELVAASAEPAPEGAATAAPSQPGTDATTDHEPHTVLEDIAAAAQDAAQAVPEAVQSAANALPEAVQSAAHAVPGAVQSAALVLSDVKDTAVDAARALPAAVMQTMEQVAEAMDPMMPQEQQPQPMDMQ
jgi:vacuolar-type H+-ATPase subunit H